VGQRRVSKTLHVICTNVSAHIFWTMKRLLGFKTTMDKEGVMTTLKENTFPTENDFQTLLFDKHYFSGQVSDKRIRIKNASRNPKNPSPIFDIAISTKDDLTEVIIHDDTDDDIWTNNIMLVTITVSISIVVLLVGGILSFVQPDNYSLLWTIIVSVIISGLGLGNSYYYKERVRLNTRGDLDFLVRLLQR
jgi:hypothetical protein